MTRDLSGQYLSAVFVDYDNIYLSLKRRSEEAAKQFAKDSYRWIRALENGRLISATSGSATNGFTTNGYGEQMQRRLIMTRCYGNPVPRRNQTDNSTDMTSFAFVRHHFLHAGFETIDCPPLTAQLKNSADIRVVMDVRDFLTHDTHIDEFVILSSDADFTPLLHRLRAHARRTVVFVNDRTAAPYQALADGEVRESDLIELLLEDIALEAPESRPVLATAPDLTEVRSNIIAEVVRSVLSASAPQPLEALAERAIRVLGHAGTVGTDWGGAGNFRDLLLRDLPATVALTEQAPYFAYDVGRAITRTEPARIPAAKPSEPEAPRPVIPAAPEPETLSSERASPLQDSIALIHQACKAPPLSPPEYRAVFMLLASEISANQMRGHQTIENVRSLAREVGIDVRKEDIRFIIDVVGKDDPWFGQGASAPAFASRFRNFVIARCQDAGMTLNTDEIDLIDAWFAGGQSLPEAQADPIRPGQPTQEPQPALGERTARWWQETTSPRQEELLLSGANDRADDEFPRIVRNRLKA